jgi:hypothetical protein
VLQKLLPLSSEYRTLNNQCIEWWTSIVLYFLAMKLLAVVAELNEEISQIMYYDICLPIYLLQLFYGIAYYQITAHLQLAADDR